MICSDWQVFLEDLKITIENKKKIAQYLPDHDIDVEIENINFKVSEDAFKKEFLQRHGIKETKLEFYYDQNRGNRFTGTCLVTLDLANCSKLIEFDGEVILI